MGFLDKVSRAATQLGNQIQGTVDDLQHKRQLGELLDDLGRIAYLDATGRPVPDAAAMTARLVEQIRQLEAQGVVVTPPQPATPPAAPPAAAPAPPPAPAAPPAPAGASGSGDLPGPGGTVPSPGGTVPSPGGFGTPPPPPGA